jgi:quinol monooxygenase YgiN
MLVIAGTFEIDPDQRDAFVAAAIAVQQASRQEEGCLLYAWTADLEDPSRVHVAEKWTSQEALDHHFTLPHIATFLAAVRGIMRGSDVLKYQVSSEGPVR